MLDRDGVAGKADDALDQVHVARRMAEDDDVAALGQGAETRPLNEGKPNGKL